jgi:hypothetical protein|nr:MAG TPA: distal tail protein [Siphoviridae sp. ctqtA1]
MKISERDMIWRKEVYNMTGVKFGEYHTYDEWRLRLTKITIGLPEPKTVLIEIPGGDGVLDLSESLTGKMQYNTRKLEFEFDARDCKYADWLDLISNIAGKIHGKRMRITLDTDPCYYYDGTIEISTSKSNEVSAKVVISANCQPYKMELSGSLEDWIWDTFSFETGIIREYGNIAVDGKLEFVICGNQKEVVPIFYVEEANGLKVEFEKTTYDLKNGENKLLEIIIKAGENKLTFTGKGKVSIDYRGGMI